MARCVVGRGGVASGAHQRGGGAKTSGAEEAATGGSSGGVYIHSVACDGASRGRIGSRARDGAGDAGVAWSSSGVVGDDGRMAWRGDRRPCSKGPFRYRAKSCVAGPPQLASPNLLQLRDSAPQNEAWMRLEMQR
ncbi:hypothetical protein J1614_004957 [Plenodomus biglobosus]|nr:hypothetical protein J1614_004957 [Plenodomus biglobosus]